MQNYMPLRSARGEVTRPTRIVSIEDWSMSAALGARRERLLDVPPPEKLLTRVVVESEQAARSGLIQLVFGDLFRRSVEQHCPEHHRHVGLERAQRTEFFRRPRPAGDRAEGELARTAQGD